MIKYKIQLSIEAKNDYKNIIHYIKRELLEPNIAEKYAILIKNEIKSLENMPNKFPIIDNDNIKEYQIRKLIIKNYIAFYRINEDEKIVNIERILYGLRDWQEKI